MPRTIVFLVLFLFASVVHASNFNFLHEAAPIADFNDEDMQMFKDTIQQALNEKRDGEKLAWKNTKTGNSGLVNPLLTLDENIGEECRHVRIVNKSKKNIAESKFKFCKRDGSWVAIDMLRE
ncbi:MAG: RT0821/Lpp0805 family surface protein [Thioalkalispiraceae bacterium]|jgi:surface antigen